MRGEIITSLDSWLNEIEQGLHSFKEWIVKPRGGSISPLSSLFLLLLLVLVFAIMIYLFIHFNSHESTPPPPTNTFHFRHTIIITCAQPIEEGLIKHDIYTYFDGDYTLKYGPDRPF